MTAEILLRLLAVLMILTGATWLGLAASLIVLRPSRHTLHEAKSLLQSVIRLVRGLSRDQEVGQGVRIRITLLLAYLASPVDLVPDFLPIIGWADDVVVLGLALRSIIKHAGTDVVRAHWDGNHADFAKVLRLCRLPEIEELR